MRLVSLSTALSLLAVLLASVSSAVAQDDNTSSSSDPSPSPSLSPSSEPSPTSSTIPSQPTKLSVSSTDAALAAVFFVVIGLLIAGTLVYVIVIKRRRDPEEVLLGRMRTEDEVGLLVENIKAQLATIRYMPLFNWDELKLHWIHHSLSWLALTVLLASLVALIVGLVAPSIDNAERVVQTGVFGAMVSLNMFVMVRQHLYYRLRRSSDEDIEQLRQAINSAEFRTFDGKRWVNWVQVFILVFEFIQLMTFPIRDLIKNIQIYANGNGKAGTKLSEDDSTAWDRALSLAALFPNITPGLFVIVFWAVFGLFIILAVIVTVIHLYNNSGSSSLLDRRPIRLYWVNYFVPVVNLLYLPLLVIFVSSAACVSKDVPNMTTLQETGIVKCHAPGLSKPLYLVAALVGYAVAYLLMTIFVSSYDRTPVKGEIMFKSVGVAFTKNMSLLLSIDFLLIPQDYRHLRSALSVVIVTALTCYNLQMKPCYTRSVNLWRSAGFCAITWTVTFIAMLTNDDGDVANVPVWSIITGIVMGSAVVFALFGIIKVCVDSATNKRAEKQQLLAMQQMRHKHQPTPTTINTRQHPHY
ncbi:hypothetical protein GQ42DRAFT_52373 [Ramicandelaber brevisporus]|nr:hypothetical protein GQ42DRAFT_52373 [Ramicandelaber brevisporus]